MRLPKVKAFTLVELLVVIGIIALLISILMPALSKARESANDLKCLNNVRQLGLAMTMYQNDYGGAFPASLFYYAGNNPTEVWDRKVAPYLNVRPDATPTPTAPVLQCPNDWRQSGAYWSQARSYAMPGVVEGIGRDDEGVCATGLNNWSISPPGKHLVIKIGNVRRAAETVALAENWQQGNNLWQWNTQWQPWYDWFTGWLGPANIPQQAAGQFYHSGGRKMSILWCDMRATMEDPRQAYVNSPASWWARTK